MAPKTADSGTRERLIDAATQLMLSQGLAATRIDGICELAGLSKGAFFHYFASKQELASAVLKAWVERGASLFDNAPFMQALTPTDRLYGYIDFVGQATMRMPLVGCMVGILSVESSSTDQALREECSSAFKQWAADIKALLKAAAPRHVNARQLNALAQHFLAVFEGALVLARAHADPGIVERQLSLFKDLVRFAFAPQK
jgi:TetR/AcrR family transcriptional regulator, transcriptional repressor for nem operon